MTVVPVGLVAPPAASRRRATNGVGWSVRTFGVLLLLVFAAGILSPILPLQDPLTTDASQLLQGPSAEHLLGTDQSGRDVFSRLIHGAGPAALGTATAVVVMVLIGVPWGLASGYLGGAVDQVGMRVADAFLSIPGLVLAVAVTAVLGQGVVSSMAAVGIVFAPSVAVLLRSSIIPIRHAEYVTVARSLGVSNARIAFRHVLPNAVAPVIVQVCSLASWVLIIQAGLGFLGLGVQPPAPSWGTDLAYAYHHFTAAPAATVFPGLILVTMAFALGRVGDGLRSKLDVG